MHKPSELADYLNHTIYEHYGHTALKVRLHDTDEHSTYYDFTLNDPALDCKYHPVNIKSETLDVLRKQAKILTGLEVGVTNKGILILHTSKEVH